MRDNDTGKTKQEKNDWSVVDELSEADHSK